MRERNINKHLAKVYAKFVNDIKDEDLAKRINDDIIISGGAITSLLLNEKPKDYDIYFRTYETTRDVALYYVNMFKELNPNVAVEPVVYSDDETKVVKINIKSSGFSSNQERATTYRYFEYTGEGDDYLDDAVGLIDEIDKIDASVLEPTKKQKKKDKKEYDMIHRPVFMTDNAISLSEKLQIIIRFFGNPRELHKNFDYVHCTNYWTVKEGLVLNPEALSSTLSKELKFTGSLYPLCSLFRMRKFVLRGWLITAGEILKIAMALNSLNLTDVDTLYDQLIGVDTAYFTELIDFIKKDRKADKNHKVNYPYICSLIDRIF